jgi:hypothetical protein
MLVVVNRASAALVAASQILAASSRLTHISSPPKNAYHSEKFLAANISTSKRGLFPPTIRPMYEAANYKSRSTITFGRFVLGLL